MARLDAELVARGLVSGRDRAAELIRSGLVTVNGVTAAKPAMPVGEGDVLYAADAPYVGRGGLKLAHALRVFSLEVRGLVAVDLGASTGGFTDCLLQNGAAHVYAIDVGHGQLDKKLLADKRVTSLEGVNARTVTRATIGGVLPDLVVADLSFISLRVIFPVIAGLLGERGRAVALIKPQFEAGRAAIGKNGVVRDRAEHLRVLRELEEAARAAGLWVRGVCVSPIRGGEGNAEYLALYTKGMNPAARQDYAAITGTKEGYGGKP